MSAQNAAEQVVRARFAEQARTWEALHASLCRPTPAQQWLANVRIPPEFHHAGVSSTAAPVEAGSANGGEA